MAIKYYELTISTENTIRKIRIVASDSNWDRHHSRICRELFGRGSTPKKYVVKSSEVIQEQLGFKI